MESQQSPSTKRATGLAFNYAPGDEDKLKVMSGKGAPISVYKDPKSDSAAFLEGERYAKEPAVEKTLPGLVDAASTPTQGIVAIPPAGCKRKPIKLFVITAKKDPKTGKLDMESAVHETIQASHIIDTNLIDSNYGLIDPSTGTIIITDPSNGQKEVVQGHIDPITKQIVVTSGAVIDPKTGKRDSNLGQIIAISGKDGNAAISPLTQIPKKRLIKIIVTTSKKDPKSGRIEAEKGYSETLNAVLNPSTGQIETKYGTIDPVNRKIIHKDSRSGKTDVRPIEIDETLGQIAINEKVVDPKTGKIDNHLGQLILISDHGDNVLPITAVTAKRDPQTGQLDPSKAHKETSNGKINPKTNDIITKYGTIEVNNRKIVARDPSTGKIEERPCQFDGQDNVIVLTGVVDPQTGNKDNNLSQILQVGSEIDPEIVVESSAGKVDRKGLDPKHSTNERSVALYDPDTNKVFTKYGVYDPIHETLSFIDPKTGKSEVKHGIIDLITGDLIFKGLVNPKSGKIDSSYGRTIKIVQQHPTVDPIAQQQSPQSTPASSPAKTSIKETALARSVSPVVPATLPASSTGKIVKIMLVTAKRDPKTGHLDVENGTVEQSVGIENTNGQIDTKYGNLDPKKGTLIINPNTPYSETLQGKIDQAGQIQFNTAVDPKTGKKLENYGQLVTIVTPLQEQGSETKLSNVIATHLKRRMVKILVITSRKDPKTGKINTEVGTVEKLTATLDPITGIIETKYGKIDPQNKKLVRKDPKTGKPSVSNIDVDHKTGQFFITENVVDPKTNKPDNNMNQVINVVDPKEPVVVITTLTTRKDPKTGQPDMKNAHPEITNGKIIPTTGEIVTKQGTINLKLMRIAYKDPKTGIITEKPITINDNKDIIVTEVLDPKTGKVDENLIQVIQVGIEVDPEVQITTYVGKIDTKKNTIDSKNTTPDTTSGLYDPSRNVLYTKYGIFDPAEETLTVTDPKSGKSEKRVCFIEPITGEYVFKGGFINPKTGKNESSFGRAVTIHITEPIVDAVVMQQPLEKDLTPSISGISEITTPTKVPSPIKIMMPPKKVAPPVVPSIITLPSVKMATQTKEVIKPIDDLQQLPRRRLVKIMVITYLKDPKTGQPDVENGQIEHITGIVDPNTGFIETKYGVIDPKNGSIVSNTPSGQSEIIQGKVDPATGQIYVSGGKAVDPITGKPDQTAGQVFSIIGLKQVQEPQQTSPLPPKKRYVKITVITTRIDPKTGKPETEKGQIEQTTGLLNPATGLIESKYGLIDPKTGKVIVNDQKTGKVDAKSATLNETNGQIVLTGVVDPKSGKIDGQLSQIISVAGQNDPVIEITTITAKKNPRTGLLDKNQSVMETTRGKKNSATGDIVTKYGTINLKLMRITTVDPSTGKATSRPIQLDDDGNVIVSSGVIDPKTDTINQELGQIIKIGPEIDPEVYVITFTGKVDSKKNTIDSKNAIPDISSAIYNPYNNKIDTKYGQINPIDGTLTYIDPKTGKHEIKQGTIDPVTGQILFKGLINPKTSKPDPNYGRIVSILITDPEISDKGSVKEIDKKAFRIDPKTSQIWSYDHQDPVTKQDVYKSGHLDPITGYIITVYGYLDPKSGTISKTIKLDQNNAKIDPETNQIYTKTAEMDETGAPLYTVSEFDPKSGQIYTKYGKIDPRTGKLVIVRVYLISHQDPNKIEEIDPENCQIDEKTGRILNITTKTVYMYSMVDPKTGKVIQVDANDPLVRSANTKVTQVMTLSGEIDPVTGKIHTEWGHIDPETGDIDPKTARKDPITEELILNYAQIDPTHFTDLKDTKVKVKTYQKKVDGTSSETETSDDDLNEYAADNLKDLSTINIPKLKKSGATAATTPVIVKTTTKQVVTKDRDGLTQNIEEKVEDGRTGEVTYSTQVNKVSKFKDRLM